MSLLSIAQSLQASGFSTFLRESGYVYPILLTTHVAGIAVFGGMILVADLRLLGVAMRNWPVSDVIHPLRPLKRIGLAIVVTGGILLACCKAEDYYHNKFFWAKMLLLVLAGAQGVGFHRSVYGNTAALDRAAVMPARAKMAGAVSLILWTCIALGGRAIGYVEPQLDQLHASRVQAIRTTPQVRGIAFPRSVTGKARLPPDRLPVHPHPPDEAEGSCER